ncbi:NAD(P)/FAD-dependent oxidoreductase (plasmid) [Pseudoalteromonas sp. T1lg65]|uniref:NAD(P)/FAD-dependent oxidoreductase n=1 Tax=Pseudoalteromonas sp. T1lg65 TaxID=2077101 RepID=UPI003F7B272D
MDSYDPLVHQHCQKQSFASSYWAATCELGKSHPPVNSNIHADIAVIGGGFSGLLTAYYLATQFNQEVVLFEANQVGFGASARNAGFVLPSSGRLGYAQLSERYGLECSKGIYQEYHQAVERVSAFIQEHSIDCNVQQQGYLKVAHNEKAFSLLKNQADYLTKTMASSGHTLLDKQQLAEKYMANNQAHGALRFDNAFGIHPLRLLLGYKRMALAAGVKIFENSLVTEHKDTGQTQHLLVNGFSVSVEKVAYTGNAYAPKAFSPLTHGRYLPILSSIIVTQPFSDEQLMQYGLATEQVIMDTRRLKYYYRRLPDNRILFGGRGAVFGKHQNEPCYQANLQHALHDCFPHLNAETNYFWSGYIAAALDDIPHVYRENNTGYILGYCGSGVAFSAQASLRLAQQLMSHRTPELPIYRKPLPKFPMPHFRRYAQMAYYHYAQFMDRYY